MSQQFPGMITREQYESGERSWYLAARTRARRRRVAVTLVIAALMLVALWLVLVFLGVGERVPQWQVALLVGLAAGVVVTVAVTMPTPKRPTTMTRKYQRARTKVTAAQQGAQGPSARR